VAFPIISSKLRGVALSKVSGLPIIPLLNFTSLFAKGTVAGCCAYAVSAKKMKKKAVVVIRKIVFKTFLLSTLNLFAMKKKTKRPQEKYNSPWSLQGTSLGNFPSHITSRKVRG
jgi:hypothetical protein